jgi:hypothetical protein
LKKRRTPWKFVGFTDANIRGPNRLPVNGPGGAAVVDAMAAITTVAVDLVVERYSTEPLSLLGGLHHQYVRI